jgi:hypothetical protein
MWSRVCASRPQAATPVLARCRWMSPLRAATATRRCTTSALLALMAAAQVSFPFTLSRTPACSNSSNPFLDPLLVAAPLLLIVWRRMVSVLSAVAIHQRAQCGDCWHVEVLA